MTRGCHAAAERRAPAVVALPLDARTSGRRGIVHATFTGRVTVRAGVWIDAWGPMTNATRAAAPRLSWHALFVEGRSASYALGGHGLPVLLLHGWGLGHRAYRSALLALDRQRLPRLRAGAPGLRRHA